MLDRNGHLNFSFQFVNMDDIVSWKWSSKKVFTTKSVYDHLTPGPRGGCFSHIWKAKLPYKLKIFTWLVEQGAVLTKSNMVKR